MKNDIKLGASRKTEYLCKVNDKHCLEEDGLEAQFKVHIKDYEEIVN